MHSDLPITVRHAVALPAEECRLVLRNFGAVVTQVDIAVRRIVAVETVLLKTVCEYDIRVLIGERVDRRVIPVAFVAHRAFIGVAVAVKTQEAVHGPYRHGIEKTRRNIADVQGFACIVLL